MPDAAILPLVFCSPMRYVQGPGIARRLANEMRSVGLEGPVLIVAGGSAITRLALTWAESFADAGWTHRVLAFGGESSRGEIEAIAAEARSFSSAAIVAAGGGKVLDAARAAAAAIRLPFVSCPTICSTDAPTSALSVIYADDGPARGSVEAIEFHRRSPDLVLVDTRIIAESPPRFLAAGIGDAVSTFYEARAVHRAGGANLRGGRSTLAAYALAQLCLDVVTEHAAAALSACRRRQPDEPLERVVEAATLLSGIGFESAGLAAAHAVHNGLTVIPAVHRMLHGEKVAFGTLVHLALEADLSAHAPARATAAADLRRLAAFFDGIGLPVTLGQLGIDATDAAAVAAVADRATAVGESIHAMPFPVDAAAVVRGLTAADAAGRLARA